MRSLVLMGIGATALSLLGLSGGCSRQAPADSPEGAVRALFEAARGGECEAVLRLVAREPRERVQADVGLCRDLLKHLQSHPIESVRGVVEDGRAAHRKIVRVALRNAKVVRSYTVEKEDGRWKLRNI